MAERSDHARGCAILQRIDSSRGRVRPFAEALRTPDASEARQAARTCRAVVPARGKESGALWGGAARPGSRALPGIAVALSRGGGGWRRKEPVESRDRAERSAPRMVG